MMSTQKQIAISLDCAANRAKVTGNAATKKQAWFLAGLIMKADEDVDFVVGTAPLTVRLASRLIDMYLAEEKLMATGLSRREARQQMMG